MHKTTNDYPTVTIFMAVFNGEKYIKEAIDSVLIQDFEDFELLIVNDGSTDNTVDVIAKFNDNRIRLLHNDGNKGLTYTRNHGLREAKGKYFAILDSDDIAMPGRLKTQVNFLNENQSIAICGGQANFTDSNKDKIPGYTVPVGKDLSHQLVIYNVFINSTLMMKTDIMREVGGYREVSPAEDYDLSFRIGLKYQVANLTDKLVIYREHGNNTSKVQAEKLKNALHSIIEHIHSTLGISMNKQLIEAHYRLLISDFKLTKISEFRKLLHALKEGNNTENVYSKHLFNKFLFEIWFILLKEKREKDILRLYFNKPLFERSFVTFKQLRKIIKQHYFLNLAFYRNKQSNN